MPLQSLQHPILMRTRLLPVLIVTALSVHAGLVNAQDTYEPLKAELAKVTGKICPKVAARFVELREVRPMTEFRPLSAETICACAKSRFQSDQQIDQILKRPHQDVVVLAKTDKFKSYVSMRYMAAILECTAAEFSATLDAANLAR